MKRLFISLILVVVSICSAYAIFDKYTIDRSQLPEEAQQMLDQYFPKAKVGMIKVDKHLLKKTDYDVRLVNGTTIEFSNKGKWTSVDCKSREVPEALIPKVIRSKVKKDYAGTKVVSIKKKAAAYELGLSDGVILTYNLLGKLTKTSMTNE